MQAAKKHILALSPAHRMHAHNLVLVLPKRNKKNSINEWTEVVGDSPRKKRHGGVE